MRMRVRDEGEGESAFRLLISSTHLAPRTLSPPPPADLERESSPRCRPQSKQPSGYRSVPRLLSTPAAHPPSDASSLPIALAHSRRRSTRRLRRLLLPSSTLVQMRQSQPLALPLPPSPSHTSRADELLLQHPRVALHPARSCRHGLHWRRILRRHPLPSRTSCPPLLPAAPLTPPADTARGHDRTTRSRPQASR